MLYKQNKLDLTHSYVYIYPLFLNSLEMYKTNEVSKLNIVCTFFFLYKTCAPPYTLARFFQDDYMAK